MTVGTKVSTVCAPFRVSEWMLFNAEVSNVPAPTRRSVNNIVWATRTDDWSMSNEPHFRGKIKPNQPSHGAWWPDPHSSALAKSKGEWGSVRPGNPTGIPFKSYMNIWKDSIIFLISFIGNVNSENAFMNLHVPPRDRLSYVFRKLFVAEWKRRGL